MGHQPDAVHRSAAATHISIGQRLLQDCEPRGSNSRTAAPERRGASPSPQGPPTRVPSVTWERRSLNPAEEELKRSKENKTRLRQAAHSGHPGLHYGQAPQRLRHEFEALHGAGALPIQCRHSLQALLRQRVRLPLPRRFRRPRRILLAHLRPLPAALSQAMAVDTGMLAYSNPLLATLRVATMQHAVCRRKPHAPWER